MMEVSRRIFRNTLFLYAAETTALLSTFALSVVIARSLGSVEFGKLAFVNSLVAIAAVLSDLGVPVYLIKHGSQDMAAVPQLTGIALVTRVVTAIVVGGGLALYSALGIDDPTTRGIALVLAGTLLVNTVPSIIGALLRIRERMHIEAAIRATTTIAFALIGIALISHGFGIVAIAWLTLGTAGASTLLFVSAWGRTEQPAPRVPRDLRLYREFFRNAFPFAMLAILGTIYFRIDAIMIEYLRGSEQVGFYIASYRLMEGLLLVPWVFSGVILPVISKNINTNREQVRVSSQQSMKLLLLVAIPLVVGVDLFAPTIIRLFFGAAFAPSIPVLQLLAPTFVAVFLSAVTATIISASERPSVNTLLAGGMVVLNVTLNLFLIPRWGISGAATATFLTELAGLIAGTLYIRRTLFRVNYLQYIPKTLIAATVMGLSILLLPSLWAIPLFLVVYVLCVLGIHGIDAEDVRLLHSLVRRAPDPGIPTP